MDSSNTGVEVDVAKLHLPASADSWVWAHYAVTDDTKMQVCLHCGQEKKQTGNTSNMIKHLASVHRLRDISAIRASLKRKRGPKQEQLGFKSPSFTTAQVQRLNTSLALFIAGDGRAVNLITGKWFRNFVKNLNPNYSIPDIKTLKKKITELNEKALAVKLTRASSAVLHFCADGWMAAGKASFLPWNFVFIDVDMTFITGLLAFEPLPANHGEVVLRPIFASIRARLSAKFPGVNLLAVEEPKSHFCSDGGGNFQNALVADGYNWKWCYCHRFHLVVVFGLCDAEVQKIVFNSGDEEEVVEEGVGGPAATPSQRP